jgi:hypothetical protein
VIQRVRAIYRDGHLVPDKALELPDEAIVEITIDEPTVCPPLITDPVERERRMKALLERMKNNPLPLDAPRFTRDELHERR